MEPPGPPMEPQAPQVKYWEISNSEGTFIIKTLAVLALWVQIKEILKIRAKMNEQMSVCPLTRFPRIGVNFRGLPFENPFRRPCLFIVTDFKTISRGASDFFDCGKNLGTHGTPHGAPPGGYLWKIPSGAPAYLLWHVCNYYHNPINIFSFFEKASICDVQLI